MSIDIGGGGAHDVIAEKEAERQQHGQEYQQKTKNDRA